MKRVLITIIFFSSCAALASGDALPTKTIFYQSINFLAVVALLTWILKKKVKISEVFKGRKENFYKLMQRAQAARNEAEKIKQEFNDKLLKLEQEAKTNAERAREEALQLKNIILSDAKEISDRVLKDANATALVELEKAKQNLKDEVVRLSIDTAQEALKTKATREQINKLQNSFVDKIQVVQ